MKVFVQAERNFEDDEICEFKLYCCYPYLAWNYKAHMLKEAGLKDFGFIFALFYNFSP